MFICQNCNKQTAKHEDQHTVVTEIYEAGPNKGQIKKEVKICEDCYSKVED